MQQDLPLKIEMPVRRFANPLTGSRITYVGMVHAALPAYYAEVGRLLADLHAQGATIHYEQVRRPTGDELADAPEQLREGVETIQARFDAQDRHLAAIGLALQTDELVLREGWQNHDICMLGAAEFYGADILRQQKSAYKHSEDMLSGLSPSVRRALVLQSMAGEVKVVTGEANRESAFPGVERQLATLRETIALAAVDVQLATSPEADIALVWGAAHLPAFSRALAQRGYEEESETWMTAIDSAALPPLQ